MQETSKIWMDGTMFDWKEAKVHVLTHSLHYGLGIFEGIRCYKGQSGSAIFRLTDHVDRLFASAHMGTIRIPFKKVNRNFKGPFGSNRKVPKAQRGVNYATQRQYPASPSFGS